MTGARWVGCRARASAWQTEQGSLLFGTDFGIVTDIQTGPDGNLWLVGTTSGTIRKITRP